MLVTQNIDDLHTREIRKSRILQQSEDPHCQVTDSNRTAFTPHIYEIHGNVYFMRCSDEFRPCSRVFMRGPSIEEFDAAYEAAPEKTITNEDGST